MNFLSTNDRQGKQAELKHTIEGLSLVDAAIAKIPMIITDHGGQLQDEGPYFMEDRQVGFKQQLRPGQTFFVILNHFDESGKVSDSHMIAGFLRPNGTEFELFDPNGNFTGEGIYTHFPNMYETVIRRFLPRHRKVEYYIGAPIACPIQIQNPCIFRSIFFILFRPHLESFKETIRVVRTLVLNPGVVTSLVEVIRQIHHTHKDNILVQHLPVVKREFENMMQFGHRFMSRSPVSTRIKNSVP